MIETTDYYPSCTITIPLFRVPAPPPSTSPPLYVSDPSPFYSVPSGSANLYARRAYFIFLSGGEQDSITERFRVRLTRRMKIILEGCLQNNIRRCSSNHHRLERMKNFYRSRNSETKLRISRDKRIFPRYNRAELSIRLVFNASCVVAAGREKRGNNYITP